MNIIIKNSSEKPIYEQIKEQIKKEILSGNLKADEKLPSIRHLVKELRVSVITTKKAYDELEYEGFINSVQGKGSFVSMQNDEILKEEYLKKLEYHLEQAIYYASLASVSKDEIVEMLRFLEDNYE